MSVPTPPGNGKPEFSFRNEGVYSATITDQILTKSKAENIQLALDIQVRGMLVDPSRPDAGLIPIPAGYPSSKRVFVTFGVADISMEQATRDVVRLGFQGDLLEQLDPHHAKGFSFVGQDILVRCQIKDDKKEFWNLFWTGGYRPDPVDPQILKTFQRQHGTLWHASLQKARGNRVAEASSLGKTSQDSRPVEVAGY